MALSSLFTGLSGIQVHQTRTNVVADNIANINTTGFKSRRANFQDLLAQTIRQATGPEGSVSGTNPVQSGIGVRLKSIDTTFSPGSLQTTGRDTDLAVEGSGFFILSDGVNRFYTRDGAFAFDALGRLVNPSNGMIVQGNVANSQGIFGATTGLTNVQLDLNQEIPGVATSRVNLSGNVDPGPVPTLTTSTEFTVGAKADITVAPATLTQQQFEVVVTTLEGVKSGIVTLPAAAYGTRQAIADGLNAAIAGVERLFGAVVAQATATGVQFRAPATGAGTTIQVLEPGTANAFTGFGAAAVATASSVAAGATELNDLAQVGASLTAGDVLRFSGTRSDGTAYSGSYTWVAGATVTNLIDAIATAFGDDVSASLDAVTGKIVFADSSGQSVTGFTVNTTLDDSDGNSGLIGADGLSQHKISTQIFDSLGRNHTMDTVLSETPVSNKWSWNVRIGNQLASTGGSGSAVFDDDGTARTFQPTEGANTVLEFAPDGEATALKVDFTGTRQSERGINGLTQFAAPSTADVVDQNGRASGRLDTIFIRTDGVIEGRFTNGETLNLARVNIANFDNQGGLQRLGGNIYAETENTGNPLIEIATETIESQVISGTLELSNVDLAQELTDLIISQRGFQANARVVTTTDQILAETVNLKQ